MATRLLRSLRISGVLLVLALQPAAAILLDDPATYHVKGTWTGESLGVPPNLGGLFFSADGSTLYVVGSADVTGSALYGIPVTRDPNTSEVVDLGPAVSVVKVFDGNPAAGGSDGLDAGWELGPAGTLFYNYWISNRLAQRPGGVGGAETVFSLGTVGIPASIAGLTFSAHRMDPGTGFGRLQVSTNDGDELSDVRDIYEVPLSPAGGGLFTPSTASLFAKVPLRGIAGMQYVPSGTHAGHLMYDNWDLGEIRVLHIDPATGLPLDRTTGVPTLGATDPRETRFASDLSVGPLGLEFDGATGDLFVSTWEGIPFNSIIQIGGFGVSSSTTTTTTIATATSTTTLPLPVTVRVQGGGNPRTDCYAVYELMGAPRVVSPALVECTDGDGSCDQDGACDGSCRFSIAMCLNDPSDPARCTPPGTTDPLRKIAKKRAAIGLQEPGLDQSACGPSSSIDVAVKLRKGGRIRKPGKTTLRVVASARKRDKDALTLRCMPQSSCP